MHLALKELNIMVEIAQNFINFTDYLPSVGAIRVKLPVCSCPHRYPGKITRDVPFTLARQFILCRYPRNAFANRQGMVLLFQFPKTIQLYQPRSGRIAIYNLRLVNLDPVRVWLPGFTGALAKRNRA